MGPYPAARLMRVLSEGTGIHRYVCLARCFAAADPCSAVSSIECAFPDSQTLLHAGVRFTQLSSCTDKNASIFRHNPWVWMPAQMLLHIFISIISQGLDAESCSTSSPSNSQGLDATPLLHTAQSSAVRKRLRRICNAVDSDRRFGNAVHSAVSRCCALLKAARHTSGCVNL